MRFTRLFVAAVLFASLPPFRPALAQSEAGFSRSQVRLVLQDAFAAILERHLEAASPPDLALWSLRGLGAIDTAFSVQVQGGVLHLDMGPRRLASRHLPGLPQAPQQGRRPTASGAEELADILSQFYADAWAASVPVRRAGSERLLQAGFDEVFNHLDPYSRYITAEEAWEARQRRVGQSGLGLRIGAGSRNSVVVVTLAPNSTAAEAGLREGDTLLAVDGIPVTAQRILRAAEALEGPPGSAVRLDLRRGGQRLSLTLQRSSQLARSLRAETQEGLLWVRISTFSATTTGQLAEVLNTAFSTPDPPRGVVLDLRGNRGGVLAQAMSVADTFLVGGVVAQSAGRHPDAGRVWEAEGQDLARGRPVVVLVDGRTASAAEIVAAALADQGRAVVVGSATLGKGLIQIVVPLLNGAEVLISWARVLAPRGWPVQGLGVLPALCTSLGLEAGRQGLLQLAQGAPPMGATLARARQARAPVPASEVVALRTTCPPAEEREFDAEAARFLMDNRVAYENALSR